MLPRFLPLSVGLVTLVALALAQVQLPYNPTRLVPAHNGSVVYIFSPQPSSTQFTLSWLNASEGVNSTSSSPKTLDSLPFLSEAKSQAFVVLPPNDEGVSVLAGDCNNPKQELGLWIFTFNSDFSNGTWKNPVLTTVDNSLDLKYLSAGFSFSPTDSLNDVSLYIFGGMCPSNSSQQASSWISNATYSNTMLNIAPNPASSGGNSPYQLSLTGARAPPVAEAGLTISPLTPTTYNPSEGNTSQQQNFVLLGGHTQNAFINMSQLAIFSLPQASWAFVEATQENINVEPRSGHTAVLTEDGRYIVVFGGWVGDVNTPAQPQLVVLNVAQEYGGQGDWAWTAPSSSSSPFPAGSGTYGHGAAMLSEGIMMVTGGNSISPSGPKIRRDSSKTISFLNTTSFEWSTTYNRPAASPTTTSATPHPSNTAQSAETTHSGLSTSEKAGLGAGLGLGLVAVAVVVIFWLLYSRRLRAKRAQREKELRELALGAERYHTPLPPGETDQRYPGMRTASWGGIQEQKIESSGDPFPWAPMVSSNHHNQTRSISGSEEKNSAHYAERTGVQMELPSPTRGLRKSLVGRGPITYQPFNQHPPTGPGAVFRIEEEDEGSHTGSLKRSKTPRPTTDTRSVGSDPFKDPSVPADDSAPDQAAAQRKKEVEGWVEDWQSVAESMTVSRSTSQAHSRTYSNLSQFRSLPPVVDNTGRGSPEKSDRTGSNLSEQSAVSTSSIQRSMVGTLSRSVSQRSASAGYALFSGAAAAMSRLGYGRPAMVYQDSGASLARAPSNRSVSLNIDTTRNIESRDGAETFSSARGGWRAGVTGEDQQLLNRGNQPRSKEERDYNTLPESPNKEKYSRAGSLTGSNRRAFNLLGSVRRVFTGTGGVDVQDRVAAFEGSSAQSSPTKSRPEMIDGTRTRSLSGNTSFWRSQRGASDWEHEGPGSSLPSSTIRRKPVPGQAGNEGGGALEHDSDWDVETAVQQRVVQVMFTVPKERLRVVNADALSLLSSNRSEVDQDEDKEREQIKRMSSVRE